MNLRVASNPGDFRRVHDLMRAEGITHRTIKTPTIMALTDDDELVGFIATEIQDHMIVAGPLVVKSDRRRVFTALRLVNAYENAMRNMGITSFIIPAEHGGLIEEFVTRYYPSVAPYAKQQGYSFYIRRLDGSQEMLDGRH